MGFRKPLLVLLGLLTIFTGCTTIRTETKKYSMGAYEDTLNQPRQIQNLSVVGEHFPRRFYEYNGENRYFGGFSHWQITFDVVDVGEGELEEMKNVVSRCRCANAVYETIEDKHPGSYQPSDLQNNIHIYLEGAGANKLFNWFWLSFNLSFSAPSTESYLDAFGYLPQKRYETTVQQP